MKLGKRLLLGVTVAVAAVVGVVQPTYATSGETTVSGFTVPESAIHDPYTDRYYVSNAGNGPGAPAAPGAISALKPDGSVINYKWIDGANPQTPLNDPLGMAVYAGKLYVADIDYVRVFSVFTGQNLANIHVSGATWFNDVTPYLDGVLVTDSGYNFNTGTQTTTDAVYKINGFTNQATKVASTPQLAKNPNGILYIPGRGVLVNSIASPTVQRLQPITWQLSDFATLPEVGFDGIARLGNALYQDNPFTGHLYKTDLTTKVTTLIGTYPDYPADLNADTWRNRLLIPHLKGNYITIKQM